jgi:hypothetical protein
MALDITVVCGQEGDRSSKGPNSGSGDFSDADARCRKVRFTPQRTDIVGSTGTSEKCRSLPGTQTTQGHR